MIKIFLYGRLTADPRISDKANCCNMGIAADSSVIIDGKPKTEFFQATIWGKKGEACAQYLKKGDPVIISGDFSSSEYKSRDGETRFSFNINNADVQFGAKGSQNQTQVVSGASATLTEVDDEELPF